MESGGFVFGDAGRDSGCSDRGKGRSNASANMATRPGIR
jgi:hypothetical protein